jgi:cysteinyl-tRNA synthetase
MLQIFNTLTGQKEPFKPIQANRVGLYVCGVTVYDLCHIGHGRTYLSFDMIVRYFNHLGFQVNHVRNITDVDDKIIARANQEGLEPHALVDRQIAEMYQDLDALGILRPQLAPRATEHMDEMIAMIQTLIEKEHAYVSSTGDVLFSVSSYADYGQLSKQNLEQLQAGARVETSANKRNPMDFVLWKMAKAGEPSWASPWGAGRPGWHIECSAMNQKHLGDHFDLHGGGSDLKFPHHENEIAQSRCAHGGHYVNTWLHSGMVMIDEEKMSKSLDNFFTIREVLKHYDAETLRYFLLSSHYRSQINYSDQNLKQARAAVERLYGALRELDLSVPPAAAEKHHHAFTQAMNDDFNTPVAYSVLFEMAKEIHQLKAQSSPAAHALGAALVKLGGILGLLQQAPEAFFRGAGVDEAQVEALIEARKAAREAKDWGKADEVRQQLQALGVVLEDKAGVTTWRVKSS